MYDCVLSILHLKNELNWTEPLSYYLSFAWYFCT